MAQHCRVLRIWWTSVKADPAADVVTDIINGDRNCLWAGNAGVLGQGVWPGGEPDGQPIVCLGCFDTGRSGLLPPLTKAFQGIITVR